MKKQNENLPAFLKAVNDQNRLKILTLLKEGPLCVCDIFPALDIPQNLASHHLKVLKDAGLVESKKESTRVIYSSKKEIINHYQKLLAKAIK